MNNKEAEALSAQMVQSIIEEKPENRAKLLDSMFRAYLGQTLRSVAADVDQIADKLTGEAKLPMVALARSLRKSGDASDAKAEEILRSRSTTVSALN